MKIRNLFIGSAALGLVAAGLLNAPSVIAQMGVFFGYPILGQPAYCITQLNPAPANANGNGAGQATTCAAMAQAGPGALTGNEQLIANTNLPGTQVPQTILIPTSNLLQHGAGSERNALVGADFLTNLWQRGTTPLSAATPSTTTMSADRWAVYSSGNTVTVTKDVTAADVAPALGVNGIMKVTRPTGTNTTSICVGQVLPAADSARFIGNEAVFSWYGEALAGYLQSNLAVTPVIAVYTAADSATGGTNTGTFMAGTITGYTVLNPNTVSTLAVPVLTNTTLQTGVPMTTSLARYSVAAYVPTQVSVSGTLTNVVGIGVELCTGAYPASTGVSTDGFAFGNAQLEATSAGTVSNFSGTLTQVAPPITTPGGFARRQLAEEIDAQLAYSYVLTDGVATQVYGTGWAVSTSVARFNVQFPQKMRETPALTVGTTISFGVTETNATATTCGTSIAGVSSGLTPLNSYLICTTGGTALTQGSGVLMIGAATGGLLTYSAEP
jgi:hypothetical protein